MEASTELQIRLVNICIQANVPVLLWGEPGVAKTAIIGAIARRLGWPFITKIGSLHDPTDFGGMPYLGEEGVELKAFKWARDLSEEKIGNKRALLFLDEFNLAQHSVMASMLRLVHEGVVGDTKLGPGVARIAAANPPEIAVVPHLLPAMGNRFCQLQWYMSPDYWFQATIAGYPDPQVVSLPDNWQDFMPQAMAIVASFVNANTSCAHDRPKDESKHGYAWPSYRTWTMAATLLAAAASVGAGDAVEAALVEGCVGSGAALAFMKYRRELDLPDPREVLKNPAGTKYPKKGDQLYAMLNSVVSYVLTHNNEENWLRCWEVLAEASKEKMDVAAASARALAKGRQAGYATPTKSAKVFYKALNLAGVAATVTATKPNTVAALKQR